LEVKEDASNHHHHPHDDRRYLTATPDKLNMLRWLPAAGFDRATGALQGNSHDSRPPQLDPLVTDAPGNILKRLLSLWVPPFYAGHMNRTTPTRPSADTRRLCKNGRLVEISNDRRIRMVPSHPNTGRNLPACSRPSIACHTLWFQLSTAGRRK
jgi:hypothetical protein